MRVPKAFSNSVDITDTPEETHLRAKLKSAEGFRHVYPRYCATCLYLKLGDGWAECLRPHPTNNKKVIDFNLGHYFSVCNRYKSDRTGEST